MIFLVVAWQTASAQNIAELKSQYEAQSGAEKAVTGIKLSRMLSSTDAKAAHDYLVFAFDYARQQNNKDILGNAYLSQSIIYGHKKDGVKALASAEKAVGVLRADKSVDYHAALEFLVELKYEFSDYSNIEALGEELIALYKEENDDDEIGFTAFNLAAIFERQKEMKKAISYYKLAINSFFKAKLQKEEVQCYYNLGGVYNNYGDYDEARATLITGLDIAKKYGLTDWQTKLEQRIDKVTVNKELDITGQTNFEREERQAKEAIIDTLINRERLSLAEIEKLSEEKQLIELKIRVQQDEYERKLLEEKIAKLQAIEEMTKEKLTAENLKLALENERLASQQKTIVNQRLYAILIGAFLVLLLIILALVIQYRSKVRLSQKNKFIAEQKERIEEQAFKIEQSIAYAKEIQEALLPSELNFCKHVPNSFVFHLPKDKVSGDFLWYAKFEDTLVVCAADCTGHGVPGAFITIVLSSILDKVVNVEKITAPNEILQSTTDKLLAYIQGDQVNKKDFKGGMDASVIRYNSQTKELDFAGACSNALLINDKKPVVLKGTRQSVDVSTPKKPFEQHSFKLYSGDRIYLFSDGFSDQKGGENNEKYMISRFRDFLLNCQSQPVSLQDDMIREEFKSWKGAHEQIDDVLVVGMEVH